MMTMTTPMYIGDGCWPTDNADDNDNAAADGEEDAAAVVIEDGGTRVDRPPI